MCGTRMTAVVGWIVGTVVLAEAAAAAENQAVSIHLRWLSVGESGIERILEDRELVTLSGYSASTMHGNVVLFAERNGAPNTVSYVPPVAGISSEAATAIGVEQVVASGERVEFHPTLAADDSVWLEMHYERCEPVTTEDGSVLVAGTTTHSFHKLRLGEPRRIPIEHARESVPTRWLEVTVRTPDSRE